ncbi:hypothetical protein [Marinifilum flexuosum]|uniref:Uncharacterized protein n=1 Tax=Marinifilum flexuosum TaxID=1117708 RepID=A0A419WMY9_9BACT|nr:hypothetical protein [Marinifilum flexuosum]RKD96845.1 hypothetical protein BXY64_3794 [Marinifilum flexuosum]
MDDIITTLFNGLTYGGDLKLSVLNYALLVIAMLPFLLPAVKSIAKRWGIVFIIAVLVQSTFWFVLGVQGISIIWNALAGMLMLVVVRHGTSLLKNAKWFVLASIAIVILGDVYFGLIFPLITTIAHVAAFLLGVILYLLVGFRKDRSVSLSS